MARQHPWDGLSENMLERVFRSESWQGTLTLVEFERFLNKLGLDGQALGSRLFAAFDGDANGYLDWKEVFIGMALLLPAPWKTKVKCAFGMMDIYESGEVDQEAHIQPCTVHHRIDVAYPNPMLQTTPEKKPKPARTRYSVHRGSHLTLNLLRSPNPQVWPNMHTWLHSTSRNPYPNGLPPAPSPTATPNPNR